MHSVHFRREMPCLQTRSGRRSCATAAGSDAAVSAEAAATGAERAGARASGARAGAEAAAFPAEPALCDDTTADFPLNESADRAFLLAFALEPTAEVEGRSAADMAGADAAADAAAVATAAAAAAATAVATAVSPIGKDFMTGALTGADSETGAGAEAAGALAMSAAAPLPPAPAGRPRFLLPSGLGGIGKYAAQRSGCCRNLFN